MLESHASGASVILGDENGRLTAIGWEFEGGQGILDNTAGQNGTVRVRKAHVGTVSPVLWCPMRPSADHTSIVLASLVAQLPWLLTSLPVFRMR